MTPQVRYRSPALLSSHISSNVSSALPVVVINSPFTDVGKALAYINANATKGIGVPDVVHHLGIPPYHHQTCGTRKCLRSISASINAEK